MSGGKIVGLLVLLAAAVGLLYFIPSAKVVSPTSYTSEAYGISFSYPADYFVAFEQTLDGERRQHAIVLAEDTPANRELASNPQTATEGPPTITVTIFQNDLDHYTLQSFVEGTSFSNFKLSDGNVVKVTVGGEPAWRYRATGLYENDNVVVVRPDYVYMFTVFYLSAEDKIRADFDSVLKTVAFAPAPAPDSGKTPSGPVACTAEAKLCPDGSAVGRTGPNCEFAQCPTSATLNAALGVTAAAGSVSVTPLEVISDSRCPIDVQCIWAGTVQVRVRVGSGTSSTDMTFELGTPVSTGGQTITLTQVDPAPHAGVAIPASSYRFTFEVA